VQMIPHHDVAEQVGALTTEELKGIEDDYRIRRFLEDGCAVQRPGDQMVALILDRVST